MFTVHNEYDGKKSSVGIMGLAAARRKHPYPRRS